jgi:hypothetical protein
MDLSVGPTFRMSASRTEIPTLGLDCGFATQNAKIVFDPLRCHSTIAGERARTRMAVQFRKPSEAAIEVKDIPWFEDFLDSMKFLWLTHSHRD